MKKRILFSKDVKTDRFMQIATSCTKITLAKWALECILRIFDDFEKENPEELSARKAIDTLSNWIEGIGNIKEARAVSVKVHERARNNTDEVTVSALRAFGQGVATAHARLHSIAAAIYAANAYSLYSGSEEAFDEERQWQYDKLCELYKKQLETDEKVQ